MGLLYTAVMDAIAVTVITDLFFIAAPTDSIVVLHEVRVSQDAQETSEQLPLKIFRTTTDNHARLECWVAFRATLKRRAAQCHALINRAIIANLGGLANHDAHAVVYEYAPPHRRTRVNFNPCEPTRDVRDKTCQPIQFIQPQGVRQTVNGQCVKTGVAGNHFPR